ncbi:MAG TPA: hypothetical protein VJ765_01730, partial [Chitinophagaceae bacterium]|nr:hypothetical protein [Chitinophagaceae bacterium]
RIVGTGRASAREQSLRIVNAFRYCAEDLKRLLRICLWTLVALSFSLTIFKGVSELWKTKKKALENTPFSFFCLPKRKKQRKRQPKTNAPLFLAGQRT